jgi:hypothetical protein
MRYRRDSNESILTGIRVREVALMGIGHEFSRSAKLASPNGSPATPPRAANSHSASVGNRFPAHFAYAAASS